MTLRFEAQVYGRLPTVCPMEPLCLGDVVDTTTFSDATPRGRCSKCGLEIVVTPEEPSEVTSSSAIH